MSGGDLASFIEEATGAEQVRIDEDLGGGFVRLRASEADRRQARQDIRCSEDIVLELLRNARDAGARLVCIATRREGTLREVTVIDDGSGIPEEMWGRIFEPRVTSRLDSFHADQWGVHGRGMALFSIACNTVEHRIAESGPGLGTAVRVVADTARLSERADQSTLPHLRIAEDGRKVMRGPRNINRIVAEFALGQRGGVLVYLGSPAQVLATLRARGMRVLSRAERAFAPDASAYPLCLRPALASSPDELAELAHGLGLELSARSARRIMDGQLEPLGPFIGALALDPAADSAGKPPARHAQRAARRRVRISDDDLRAFGAEVGKAFRAIAPAYYLDASVEPQVRVARDGLHVTIPFADEEEDLG